MKTLRPPASRLLMCVLLAAAMWPAVARAEAAGDAEVNLPKPASRNPCLKYLPADYWLVVSLDCRTLMTFLTSEEAQANPQYPALLQVMQTFQLMTGINFEKEVETVAFFAAGNPNASPTWLLVGNGSFDNGSVEQTLRTSPLTAQYTPDFYKEKTVFHGPEGAFFFPEASTIVVGDFDLVKQTVDKLAAANAPALPEALGKLLDRTNGDSIVWAAAKREAVLAFDDLADWRTANAELCDELGKLDCLSLAFSLSDDGLLVNTVGYSPQAGDAKLLHDYLSARKSALLKTEGVNVFFCSFLVLSELNTDGAYNFGSLRLTGQALEELWNTKVTIKP